MKEYAKMSPAELALQLGLTEEEAAAVLRSWGYQPPAGLEELRRHNNRATRYEYEMRGLNSDLSAGRITREEYEQKERQLYRTIHGNQ